MAPPEALAAKDYSSPSHFRQRQTFREQAAVKRDNAGPQCKDTEEYLMSNNCVARKQASLHLK